MSDDTVTRRQFARRLALGASAMPILATISSESTLASESDAPIEAGRPAEAAEARVPEAPLSPTEQADLLVKILASRYPHPKLTPKILDQIRADIQGDLIRSILLSSYPLKNSDGPGFVFTPWRGDAIG